MKVLCKPCRIKHKLETYQSQSRVVKDEFCIYMIDHLQNNTPIPVKLDTYGWYQISDTTLKHIYTLHNPDYYIVEK